MIERLNEAPQGEIILPPDFEDRVLNWQGSSTFEANYASSTRLRHKFYYAKKLIEGGIYAQQKDPLFLLRNFIPRDDMVIQLKSDEERLQAEAEIKAHGKELYEDLQLLLVEKGHIKRGTHEDEEAQKVVETKLAENINVKELVDAGWPLEVVGQIMTLELFENVTDAKKIEELRAWVTTALIRPYIGLLTGTMPQRDMDIVDMIDRVPKKIFRNIYAIKYNLVQNYLEQSLSRSITDAGLQEGMKQFEEVIKQCTDPDKKQFLEKIHERFYDIATFPLKGEFKSQIQVKDQTRPFPSFEQRTFCYDFVRHNTRLLAADTGLGKTSAAYLAMENSDAARVLVFATAAGKETWEIESNVAFTNPDQVYIVKGSGELKNAANSGKKYIVISQELLEDTQSDSNLLPLLEETLIKSAKVDASIIDEIDNFNNYDAISSKALLHLIGKIRQNYQERTGNEDAPILGLTATPIRSKLANLNVPMSILYPSEYVPVHEFSTARRKTFSDAHLNRPDLVYMSLIGEKRMFRWEQATGVQEFRYTPFSIQASPFEEYLHQFIEDNIQTNPLNKIRLLEDALLNPLLTKVEIRRMAKDKIQEMDIDETLNILKLIVPKWKEFKGVDSPQKSEDFLSADRLVEIGMGDLVLSCFFSELLENGVDTLVEELTKDSSDADLAELRKFWMSRKLSTKYKTLKRLVTDSLTWRQSEDGRIVRDKVFIISPSRRQGRTGDVLQRAINQEDGSVTNLYTSYELDTINDFKLMTLLKSWVSGLCSPEDILMIDGTIGVGRPREAVISRWVNNPSSALMLVTLEATYQSRDYTLNALKDEQDREIVGVRKIFLGPPWHFQQLKQMVGRSQRQGQLVPVENLVLEVKDMVDQGKGEAVVYSYLLSRMALSGIVLHPDQQEFFDSKRLGNRIEIRSKDSLYLSTAFHNMTGAGAERTLEMFHTNEIDPQRIAVKFYDEGRDEYHITGYNADFVSHLIKTKSEEESQILSVGAGTLLLQRKLKRGIDNVDINPYILQVGWEKARIFGGTAKFGRADELESRDDTYDFLDNAFVLHYSSLSNKGSVKAEDSERTKILRESNRVLKNSGYFSLTLPERVLDDDKFRKFTAALEEHFGFKVDQEYSGRAIGISKLGTKKSLGWSILAQKVGEVDLKGLTLSDLELLTDSRAWLSIGPKANRRVRKSPGTDYPSPQLRLELDHFEIYNPNVTTTQKPEIEIRSVDTDKDVELILTGEPLIKRENSILDFLRGVSIQDFRDYRTNLIRPISRITGWDWPQAEEFCIRILQDLSVTDRMPKDRLNAFSYIIREARRQLISGNGRG
ncbi:methyltransferase domain-containing protein [Candidatus Curtissbacteria bacterium]|nr:methyltransferase domain-containing protein [Candidatus Curtissbacteria bacterium]